MKIKLLLIVSLFTFVLFGQYSDLGNMSDGIMKSFHPVLDNSNDVYGYIAVFELEKVDKKTKKFEYIFLDKNLNKVSSQEFTASIRAITFYGFLEENGDFVLYPSYDNIYDYYSKKVPAPKPLLVDMKNNTIVEKQNYCYENEQFKICDEEYIPKYKKLRQSRKERKKEGSEYISVVKEIKDGSFLVYDYNLMGKNGEYSTDNRIQKYDKNKNKVWEFKFNSGATKKENEKYYLIQWEEDYAYYIVHKQDNKDESYSIVAIDVQNGKMAAEYDISANYPNFSFSNLFYYDNINVDNTLDTKNFFRVLSLYFGNKGNQGYMTFTFDKNKKDFTVNTITYLDMNKVANNIEFKEDGSIVGEKEDIKTRDIYFMEDGSVSILTEKMRSKGNKLITTDMVIMTTDKDLNPKEVLILEKDKTKGYWASDYLFSQNINEGKDVVFFYRDYEKDDETKDKNWVLYINTIIDGKFNQEQIPISSDENFIIPSIAKEGYILLREFNKNAKYDQIRLERLNF